MPLGFIIYVVITRIYERAELACVAHHTLLAQRNLVASSPTQSFRTMDGLLVYYCLMLLLRSLLCYSSAVWLGPARFVFISAGYAFCKHGIVSRPGLHSKHCRALTWLLCSGRAAAMAGVLGILAVTPVVMAMPYKWLLFPLRRPAAARAQKRRTCCNTLPR